LLPRLPLPRPGLRPVDALDRHGFLLDEQNLTRRRNCLIRDELLAAIVRATDAPAIAKISPLAYS